MTMTMKIKSTSTKTIIHFISLEASGASVVAEVVVNVVMVDAAEVVVDTVEVVEEAVVTFDVSVEVSIIDVEIDDVP